MQIVPPLPSRWFPSALQAGSSRGLELYCTRTKWSSFFFVSLNERPRDDNNEGGEEEEDEEEKSSKEMCEVKGGHRLSKQFNAFLRVLRIRQSRLISSRLAS